MAFWVNAYNAFVLQTVINHYPLRGTSAKYPPRASARSPARSKRIRHRAAGRNVTLDEIEKTILPEFKEPRLYLALGRGARRQRPAAQRGLHRRDRIDEQLADIQKEFVSDRRC